MEYSTLVARIEWWQLNVSRIKLKISCESQLEQQPSVKYFFKYCGVIIKSALSGILYVCALKVKGLKTSIIVDKYHLINTNKSGYRLTGKWKKIKKWKYVCEIKCKIVHVIKLDS